MLAWSSRTASLLSGSVGFALLAGCGAAPDAERGEQVDQEREELFAAFDALGIGSKWPVVENGIHSISVCFALGYRSDVKDMIQFYASEWANAANLRFTGWGTCDSDRNGKLVITLTNEPISISEVGYYPSKPTEMRLSLGRGGTAEGWYTTANKVLVLHEFAHALGFSHEFDREDVDMSDIGCPESLGTGHPAFTDPYGTLPDYFSITLGNYCNVVITKLSGYDIVGAQKIYGLRKQGTLSHPDDGRCLDIPGDTAEQGEDLRMLSCSRSDDQAWGLNGHGFITAFRETDADWVLTAGTDGNAEVRARKSGSPVDQMWTLRGRFVGFGGNCVNLDGSSLKMGACTGDSWDVETSKTQDDRLRIRIRKGERCWQVPNSDTAKQGDLLTLGTCENEYRQKFAPTTSGALSFRGLCLEVADEFPYGGSQLRLYECVDSDSDFPSSYLGKSGRLGQRFHFRGIIQSNRGGCLILSADKRPIVGDCATGSFYNDIWNFYLYPAY